MRSRKRGRRGKKLSRATRERDAYALKDHILPACGDWIVSEITFEDLQRLVDYWMQKPKDDDSGELYGISSVNTWIKVLRIYMRHCCRMEGVESPAEHLEYLAEDDTEQGRALRPKQVRRFLEYMEERFSQWYPMCVLGFMTGARFATLSALRWEDVDYDAGVIRFMHSQYRGKRKKRDKSGKRIRVPLLAPIARVLQEHRVRMIRDEHPGLATGLVFPSTVPDGVQNGHVSASALRNAMKVTCEEIRDKLREELDDPTATFPMITAHDMRRTFNTIAFERRLDHHVIQAVTGHSTDRMSFHYDHVSEERKAAGLSELAEVFELT